MLVLEQLHTASGYTPIYSIAFAAAETGQVEFVEWYYKMYLIGNEHERDWFRHNLLHIAVKHNQRSILDVLYKMGYAGRFPEYLHVARSLGYKEIEEALRRLSKKWEQSSK